MGLGLQNLRGVRGQVRSIHRLTPQYRTPHGPPCPEEMDMEDVFWEIPTPEVHEALAWALKLLRGKREVIWFAIRNRGIQKKTRDLGGGHLLNSFPFLRRTCKGMSNLMLNGTYYLPLAHWFSDKERRGYPLGASFPPNLRSYGVRGRRRRGRLGTDSWQWRENVYGHMALAHPDTPAVLPSRGTRVVLHHPPPHHHVLGKELSWGAW